MLKFFAIGDWGRGGAWEQQRVANAMARVAHQQAPRFVVSTGDNFYDDGLTGLDDPHLQDSFENVYSDKALQIPWYAVAGNHDHHGSIDALLQFSRINKRWNMPATWYSVEHEIVEGVSIEFFFIDTTPFIRDYYHSIIEPIPTLDFEDANRQQCWLQEKLRNSQARWKVVVGHHPVISGSPFHGSEPDLDSAIGPLLAEYSVDLYLCGHEHDLQHLRRQAVHHIVCGAGAEQRQTGALPETCDAFSTLGFAMLEVTATHFRAAFYDDYGTAIYRCDLN